MRIDRKMRAVVTLNGKVLRDVLWADDITGEVCVFERDAEGKLVKGETQFLTQTLRGDVEIKWPA